MPQRSRPKMGVEYGLKRDESGMLTWGWVSGQMQQSRNYWVCTTRPDGAPHAAPIWGVWLDDVLYFATSAASRKGRNLTADPRLVVHLESGDETVIIEGHAEIVTNEELLQRIVRTYGQKYPYTPELPLPAGQAFYRLVPATALAWLESDFPTTAARFTF